MPETPTARAALLIDADNFHDAVQLRAAYEQFVQHTGKGAICHVHGADHILHKENLKSAWLGMAARLFPCLPLRKNTADAALVCDALMLHFRHGVTRFGICSGDADFAPLALQLRELGCEVICFARMDIAFNNMTRFYDKVVRFDEVPEPSPATTRPGTAIEVTGLPAPAPKLGIEKESLQKIQPPSGKSRHQKCKPAASGVNKSTPPLVDKQAVKKILAALPDDWAPQTIRQLNRLGGPLRAASLSPSSKPLHQLFRKYPDFFTVLSLGDKPCSVRLERRP